MKIKSFLYEKRFPLGITVKDCKSHLPLSPSYTFPSKLKAAFYTYTNLFTRAFFTVAAHQRAVGRALLITVFTSSAFQRACSHLTRLLALMRDTPHWTASIDTVLNASLLGFTKCSTGTTDAVLAKK